MNYNGIECDFIFSAEDSRYKWETIDLLFNSTRSISVLLYDSKPITGRVYRESTHCLIYCYNGLTHRTDGPASQFFAPAHNAGAKSYWLNGVSYKKEEWFLKLNQKQKYDAIWNM